MWCVRGGRPKSTSSRQRDRSQPRRPYFGHFFHPLPCPLSFHCLMSAGMPSMAFLLSSSFPLSVRSHSLPLTFFPIPVPCTRRPFSMRFCSLTSGCLGLRGINGSTLCCEASLKRSACLRKEYRGPCQLPVRGFLNARNGFRYCVDELSNEN